MLRPEERRSRQFESEILEVLRGVASSLKALVDEQQRGTAEAATKHYDIVKACDRLGDVTHNLSALVEKHDEENRKQERRFRTRSLVVQWCLFGATFAAFVAAAWYAHVASQQKDTMDKQWSTMDRTYGEIKKQTESAETAAKAAKKAADLSLLQAEGTTAAFIDPIVGFTKDRDLFVRGFNYGHVTAYNIRITATITCLTWPGKVAQADSVVRTLYKPELRVRGVTSGRDGIGPADALSLTSSGILTEKQWNAVGMRRQYLRVQWGLRYDNGFGRDISIEKANCVMNTASISPDGFDPVTVSCDQQVDYFMKSNAK